MKKKKQIEKEIRRLKNERKELYLEYINVFEVMPHIAVIGISKYTTQIRQLRWVLK